MIGPEPHPLRIWPAGHAGSVEHSLIAVQRDKVRKDGGKGGESADRKRDEERYTEQEKEREGLWRSWEELGELTCRRHRSQSTARAHRVCRSHPRLLRADSHRSFSCYGRRAARKKGGIEEKWMEGGREGGREGGKEGGTSERASERERATKGGRD